VDSVGVGVATVNAFLDYPINMTVQSLSGGQWEEAIPRDRNDEDLMYRFASLRAQMYWELREDHRKRLILCFRKEKIYVSLKLKIAPRYLEDYRA